MSDILNQTGDQRNTNGLSTFLLAEYKELRAEILKRSEIQHQLISFSLAALAALTTVGLRDSPSALLIYPIVTLGLSVGWAYNDLQIAQLGLYIKHRIEAKLVGSLGWQHTIALQVASKEIGHLAKLATRGIFWTSAGSDPSLVFKQEIGSLARENSGAGYRRPSVGSQHRRDGMYVCCHAQ